MSAARDSDAPESRFGGSSAPESRSGGSSASESRSRGSSASGSRSGGSSAPESRSGASKGALRARTPSGTLGAWIGLGLGALYLINPTMGLLELLPDNLPIVGNLDEAGAAGLVLGALAYLGIDLVGPFRRRGGGPPDAST